MKPRYYQKEAVESVWQHLNNKSGNPCIVIPTAGGKSYVMGSIANTVVNDFGGRVMLLAHVKELLQQNQKACAQVNPNLAMRTGIYSAGLKSREYKDDIVVAGIQSAYKDATKFGKRDLIIVDEAHLIAPKVSGMYMRFLSDAYKVNPNIRVVGLTATPYRMKGGMICGPDNMLNEVCYDISVKRLIDDGFLSKMITKATADPVDFSSVRTLGGEFDRRQVSEIIEEGGLVEQSCQEIYGYTKERNSVILFCHSVEHSHEVARTLERITNDRVAEVYGDTHADERRETLTAFKAGSIKYLCNVGVLTTGFDAPNIDCVVLLMPTKSPGKYYQCVGRGFRIHPGKGDCLVLDYGGNIMRHGPVDAMQINDKAKTKTGQAPARTCPDCQTVVHISVGICPECGYIWPVEEKEKHDARASSAPIISGEVSDEVCRVQRCSMEVHKKKGGSKKDPRTVRIDYQMMAGWKQSEWVCPEHSGYARQKFIKWWSEVCEDPEVLPPKNADYVIEANKIGIIKLPGNVTIRTISGNKYGSVHDRDFSVKPITDALFENCVTAGQEQEQPSGPLDVDWGEIPF